MVGEGLRRGIKRGKSRWGLARLGISMPKRGGTGWPDVVEKGGGVTGLSDAGEEGKELTRGAGPRVSDRRKREKAVQRNCLTPTRKRISKDTARAFGPIGPTKEAAAGGQWPIEGERASAADLGWSGRTLGRIPMEVWFLNFKDFQNLVKLGEILQGDLEGIWTWGIFLNSSSLLKDF
jgi:hypothetical protein